jgi:DNA-binding HxlR family transcriptional regulator
VPFPARETDPGGIVAPNVPDVIEESCATRQALERLASKWRVLLVYALLAGPQRHSQLRRRVPGITQKVLTEALRDMERDGWWSGGWSGPRRRSTSSTR